MPDIVVKKLPDNEIQTRGIPSWPVWQKEASRFNWHYDQSEECYLLEGDVMVETPDGQIVHFGKGDFVVFPQGLSCVWEIKTAVKKHYRFV